MDIQVSCEEFRSFLKKCHTGGLVKDLVVQADKENGIFARFSTKEKSSFQVFFREMINWTTPSFHPSSLLGSCLIYRKNQPTKSSLN